MKKFVLNTLLFVLFSGLFYFIALFFWGKYTPSMLKRNINYKICSYGHIHSRLSEVKKKKDIDILFLGSSHTYRGFDTRIFSKNNLQCFNLGSSSQTPIQTETLLKRYLKRLKPKTIIYEVYPITFMIDGVESSLDIIANDKNDLFSLEMVFKNNNIKTYNTFLYALFRDIFNLNNSYSEPKTRGNDTYISGGFVEKEISYFKPTPFEKETIEINKSQLKSFSKIVSLIKKNKIDLILVYAPIPPSNYKRFTNNEYFDNTMESYSEYYNFNKLMSLNDSLHFFDAHHLNQKGVELFNNKLIKILNERKVK
ncbi:MAG: hypothetical protein MI739_09410 [Bacteroidales bacterium]|nr:hypothetical protein [Bacteroidales bacterium]